MAAVNSSPDEAPKPKSRLALLLGLGLALLLGGGGFFLTYSGLLLGADGADHAETAESAAPAAAFVPLDPVMISLGTAGQNRHLRLVAQLEVPQAKAAEVTHLTPRILDVINAYLRAVEVARLEEPAALVRIRGHLLSRIQLVTGEGMVDDLLITEFLIN